MTAIDDELIIRLKVILQALSSKFDINAEDLEDYVEQTKWLLTDLYPWYNQTPTIHKLLDHSLQVIQRFPLPIGMFTEEALEARNEVVRRYRQRHTRKTSRRAKNIDIMSMLLVSSDPLIEPFRKQVQRKSKPLGTEALSTDMRTTRGIKRGCGELS